MPAVKFVNVNLSINGNKILKKLSFIIEDGEYFAIVGETGAGKTSILNIVNGLYRPTSGRLIIGDEDFTKIPAENRDIGRVFEEYALFPHYDVYKNVAYSHRVRDRDVKITKKAAKEVLNLMLLYNRDDALPVELSGGMQQRVALARALMTDSGILLMDDPFSALDAGLRMDLRIELKNLAKDLGTTVIHCTNDVEEAMMVCNRMALMKDGKILQIGTPDEIYYHPLNLYIASFLGDVNLLECKVQKIDEDINGHLFLDYQTKNKTRTFHIDRDPSKSFDKNENVVLLIRAEHLQIIKGRRKKYNRFYGTIDEISFLGNIIRYEVIGSNGKLYKVQRFVNQKTKHLKFNKGDDVTLYFNSRLGLVFPRPGDEEFTELKKNI